MNLTSPKQISELLSCHGFTFSKSLGQNFLINAAIPEKIAESAGITSDSTVLEIGPGIGCLTRSLAQRAKRVIAVEIDARLLPILKETLADYQNVTVINADILKMDLRALTDKYGKISICANLPYYITTPILMYILESKIPFSDITIMIQREVAQRLCAAAGSKEYGAISAAVQYYTTPKTLFTVSPGSFIPAPKVDSAVVRLSSRIPPQVNNEQLLFKVIRAGFLQRRKTLSNALASGLGLSKTSIETVLTKTGFSPSIRAEKLSVEEFCLLSNALDGIKN